ncbi:MAG: ribosomal protein S18-alanine N-acetyltransferase [Candidatus Promineifilaceae bacterium]|jgi:ribosomal-protein-alanine N-acetyltransferase
MLQPPSPFLLRPLQTADIPDVLAIEERSFPTARSQKLFLYELTQNNLAHYQALTRLEPNGGETLLGYAGYWVLADEVHVSTIAVDPSLRRHGLGQLLLLNILFLSYTHQASLVTLEVRVTNTGAQELYKQYRFLEVGLRKGYYHDTGEDAILMTVMLQDAPDYKSFLEQKRDNLFRHFKAP